MIPAAPGPAHPARPRLWLSDRISGRITSWISGAALGLLGLASAACTDENAPRLFAVSPTAAQRNQMVTITGTRLCGGGDCARAAGEIDLGRDPPMVRAIVTDYSDSVAQIVIPPAAPVGRTALIATVNEKSSNALDFEVLEALP